jgi:chromosomal replication initiator protein
MAQTDQRLISRFEWGIVADIKPPDLETRIAILRKKQELEGFEIPEDIALFLAGAFKTNVRNLEGALIRLTALSKLTGISLSLDSAKDILKDSIPLDTISPVRPETIQRVIAHRYSIEVRDLKSQQRSASFALPRQIAMYLCCAMTDLTLTQIGGIFGGKDHSTVIHARDKVKKRLEEDPFFSANINKLQADIRVVDNE